MYYYQYARPNDKLPSVKRAFLRRPNGKCAGWKYICRPDDDWLQGCQTTSLGQWDPEDTISMPELARIFVDEFALAHLVALQWTFDVWRFYLKMEEVPSFQHFSSQNSDSDNEQVDEIGQTAQANNTKRATVWGVKKCDKWCEKRKNFSGSQNSKSNGLEWSENRERTSINSKCIDWN